jgi:hypothetical protein
MASSLCLAGCLFTTPKRKLVLPPPAPAVAKELPQPRIDAPPDIETKVMQVEPDILTLKPLPPWTPPAQAETPTPRPAPRRSRPSVASEGEPPPEVEHPPQPPVTATPQLTEILTDERRRAIETDFLESVARAQAVVNRASGRKLTPRQTQTMQRIRTFLQQAQESRSKDLVTALQLAHRADLLGRDLQRSLP